MSDRIAVLNVGHVEQYDSPETIYHNPSSEFVARFVGKSNWLSENELFRQKMRLLLQLKELYLTSFLYKVFNI